MPIYQLRYSFASLIFQIIAIIGKSIFGTFLAIQHGMNPGFARPEDKRLLLRRGWVKPKSVVIPWI